MLQQVEPRARRILLAVNPRAGARAGDRHVQQLRGLLERQGYSVSVCQSLDQVTQQAHRLHADGQLRCLVAVGGDGTAAELVNRTPAGLPIAIYPLGTANLLASYVGLRANPFAFAEMIAEGRSISFDAGCANGRVFLLMAGCGFDADVVRRLHERRSGHISKWSYAKPILSSIRSYQYPLLRISCEAKGDDCQAWSTTARWAFVANLPAYGGGLRLTPAADGTDGLLNVCTFQRGSLWHGLRYLGFVLARQHYRLADCTLASGCRLRIESDDQVPYQLDGDPGGTLPLEIEVLPARFQLMVPAACRLRASMRAATAEATSPIA
jgi:YegS/Rv2252/BmrU family lipid kinase